MSIISYKYLKQTKRYTYLNMVDILDISEELKNFASNGVTLNIEERIQLEMALHELQSKINAEELMFWGKINGLEKDYYIAVSLQYSG